MHQPAKMAQMAVRDVLCKSHTMKPARMNAQTSRPPMTHTALPPGRLLPPRFCDCASPPPPCCRSPTVSLCRGETLASVPLVTTGMVDGPASPGYCRGPLLPAGGQSGPYPAWVARADRTPQCSRARPGAVAGSSQCAKLVSRLHQRDSPPIPISRTHSLHPGFMALCCPGPGRRQYRKDTGHGAGKCQRWGRY